MMVHCLCLQCNTAHKPKRFIEITEGECFLDCISSFHQTPSSLLGINQCLVYFRFLCFCVRRHFFLSFFLCVFCLMDIPETFEHGKKPVIAIDLDEVLGYFVRALCNYHNETYGTSYCEGDFHSYTFRCVWGGTEEESSRKVHDFLESDHFLKGIDVVPGAKEALLRLKESYDLVICTSRQHVIAQTTHEWIERHYPNIFSSVLFGNHYGKDGVKKSKPEMTMAINAEFLIDDALHYADQCAGHLQQVLLFGEYAWNKRDEPMGNGITRVKDWVDVLNYFDSVKERKVVT
eukprot:m.116931 g.116931  ORF g.116931 m.116931 type:complete len:290 (+) comp12865_c0_seq5:1291-2160(+)